MNGRDDMRRKLRLYPLTTLRTDAKVSSEERLSRCRPHADDHFRFQHCDFSFDPWLAGSDFQRIRLLVNPSLAARLPLEVLHRVRHVRFFPGDTGLFED